MDEFIEQFLESVRARGKEITDDVQEEALKVEKAYRLAVLHGQWEEANIVARQSAARIFMDSEREARELWTETLLRGFSLARVGISLIG